MPRPRDPDTTVDSALETMVPDRSFESVPERIGGRYEILGLLGVGGMGSVYRVRDSELDEVVALKFLRPDRAAVASVVRHLHNEVRVARRVTHANVARTYDIGEHDGDPFLTMEYIEGEPLSRIIRREGPASEARATSRSPTGTPRATPRPVPAPRISRGAAGSGRPSRTAPCCSCPSRGRA